MKKDYGTKYKNLNHFFIHFYAETDNGQETSVSEIIQKYFTGTSTTTITLALYELNLLLEENLTEAELERVAIDMGVNFDLYSGDYNPSARTYKEWLLDLRVILKNELQRRMELE